MTLSITLKSSLGCGLFRLQEVPKRSTGPPTLARNIRQPCPATFGWPKGGELSVSGYGPLEQALVLNPGSPGRVPFQDPLQLLWELLLCLSVRLIPLFSSGKNWVSLCFNPTTWKKAWNMKHHPQLVLARDKVRCPLERRINK